MVNHQIYQKLPDMIFFTYKLLFSKEKPHIFYILNFVILLYFYIELFYLRRSIQSKNGHDHWALLSIELLLKRKRFLRFFFSNYSNLKIHSHSLCPTLSPRDHDWSNSNQDYQRMLLHKLQLFCPIGFCEEEHFYLLQY